MKKRIKKTYVRYVLSERDNGLVEVVKEDLRALLFWANVGVRKSKAGSYRDIEEIIKSYSQYIKYQIRLERFRN